jgi:hypothetical protein
MPSGLFRKEEGRWVFAGPTPPAFKASKADQADLLVRYLLELTPQEQQRLIQMSGGKLTPASAKPATSEVRGSGRMPASSAGRTLTGMILRP